MTTYLILTAVFAVALIVIVYVASRRPKVKRSVTVPLMAPNYQQMVGRTVRGEPDTEEAHRERLRRAVAAGPPPADDFNAQLANAILADELARSHEMNPRPLLTEESITQAVLEAAQERPGVDYPIHPNYEPPAPAPSPPKQHVEHSTHWPTHHEPVHHDPAPSYDHGSSHSDHSSHSYDSGGSFDGGSSDGGGSSGSFD